MENVTVIGYKISNEGKMTNISADLRQVSWKIQVNDRGKRI